MVKRIPDAVLLLGGPGESDQRRIDLFRTTNIRDLGIPNERDKADAYAACDIFCLPSAHESFGIVYVEAWSYGKPVICGTAPASRELIENGVTGLWASQNPTELADCLVHLLTRPEIRTELGGNGLRRQLKSFTAQMCVEGHFKAFGLRVKGNLGSLLPLRQSGFRGA